MARFCPACGTQRADGSSFCGQCGHPFAAAAASGAEPAAAPPPAPPPPAAARPLAATAAPLPPPAGSASSSGIRTMSIVAGVALFVFGMYQLLHGLGVIGGHRYGYSSSYSYGSRSHPAGALVFLGVFLLLTGAGFLVWGLMKRSKVQASARLATSWPAAPGVILGCQVTQERPIAALFAPGNPSQSRYYTPRVHYRYPVGRDYDGTRIRFGALNFRTRAAAEAVVQPYPVNAPVMVRYDPANPAESVLELQTSGGGTMVAIVFGGMMAGLGVMLLVLGPALG